jgi:PAP2 superfamily C-terminal
MPDTVHVLEPPSSTARAWSEGWSDRRFRAEVMLTLAAFVGVLVVMSRFLAWVEVRPGVVLPDAVLAAIPARDMTWVTFALLYAGILTAVAALLPYPRRLMLGLQSYVVLVVLRMVVMSVTPLEAPPGMIVLRDPLVQILGGTGAPLTKDLFFSGHTSTMFLLSLLAPGRVTRSFFLVCTVAVGACVLWQHVHYTVDVLAAPLFAYASYAGVSRLHARRRSPSGG